MVGLPAERQRHELHAHGLERAAGSLLVCVVRAPAEQVYPRASGGRGGGLLRRSLANPSNLVLVALILAEQRWERAGMPLQMVLVLPLASLPEELKGAVAMEWSS